MSAVRIFMFVTRGLFIIRHRQNSPVWSLEKVLRAERWAVKGEQAWHQGNNEALFRAETPFGCFTKTDEDPKTVQPTTNHLLDPIHVRKKKKKIKAPAAFTLKSPKRGLFFWLNTGCVEVFLFTGYNDGVWSLKHTWLKRMGFFFSFSERLVVFFFFTSLSAQPS